MPLTTSEQRPRNALSTASPQIDSGTNSMKPAYAGPFNAVPWQGASRQTPGNQILRSANASCGINPQVNGGPSLTTPYSKLPEGQSHDARYGGGNENIPVPGKNLFTPAWRLDPYDSIFTFKLRNGDGHADGARPMAGL